MLHPVFWIQDNDENINLANEGGHLTSVIQVSCLECCPSVVWWVVPASHWFLHVTSVTTCLQCFGQQAHHPAVHTDCSYSGGGSALHVSELCFASPAPLSLLLQYGIQFWCRLTQVACNTGRMSKDEDDDVSGGGS